MASTPDNVSQAQLLAEAADAAPTRQSSLWRDAWHRMIRNVDSWIPIQYRDTVRELAREVDAAIAGFVRGRPRCALYSAPITRLRSLSQGSISVCSSVSSPVSSHLFRMSDP